MTHTLPATLLAFVLTVAAATPAFAADKEHRQMMADLRILQEQSQQLQMLLGSVNDALKAVNDAVKAVNTRLDDQTNSTRRMFADQKLTIDTLSNDLRVVREKVDDNNVRIGSLTQELDALRQSVQQLNGARPSVTEPDAGATSAAPSPGVPVSPAPSLTLGASPTRAWESAWSDYTSGQYDLAILGFDAYIRDFSKSDMADDAQVLIGKAYLLDNKYDKAVEAFDTALRTYPNGNAIPDAYFQKGLALNHLGDRARAREAFEYVVKTFPESDAGRLAKQQITPARP